MSNMTYYIQVNVMCLLLLAGVLIVIHNRRETLPARTVLLIRLIWITMVMCVADVFAWYANGADFNGARLINIIGNMLYYATITATGYIWLAYVNVCLRPLDFDHRRYRRLSAIPLIVILILLVTTPFTHYMFSVDEANVYSRGPGVILHWIISYGYIIFALIQTIIVIKKAKSRREKEEILPLLYFVALPFLATVIQAIFYGVTTTQCGVTFGILTIVFSFLVGRVTKDPLTGLNNRGAFDAYINEKLHGQGGKFSILICDVDNFKQINDTFGHPAGDLVLKNVADVLKDAVGQAAGSSLFLCRYGGDEFVYCGMNVAPDAYSRIEEYASERLAPAGKGAGESGRITLSCGSAEEYCTEYSDYESVLRKADAEMYKVKRAKKISR